MLSALHVFNFNFKIETLVKHSMLIFHLMLSSSDNHSCSWEQPINFAFGSAVSY